MSLDDCGVHAVFIGILNGLLVSALGDSGAGCAVSKLYYMKLDGEVCGGRWSAYRAIGARGEWRMENGEWRMENGEWRMENGEWSVECGVWSVECGVRVRVQTELN